MISSNNADNGNKGHNPTHTTAPHKLVIAEKPSVGKALADVLGAKSRKDGYFEGSGYVISWCLGHLLALAEPKAYDEKYAKWRFEDLPIIPKEWKYTASPNTKEQLKILTNLMKRSDIGTVINACDAGREGELIFRTVYEHSNCRKPILRLWINSMEESAIVEGFYSLKHGTDYETLYQSALCRSRADWTVGMNGSRAFSILHNAPLSVGRVQTPTLAMVVEREHKISGFIKEPFYVVELTGAGFTLEREKVKDKATAESILAACNGKTAVIQSLKKQEKSVSPPKLYDLTALQREANRIFGYTAADTLSAVQSLYERKLSTYPRTDGRYITADMEAGIPPLVENIKGVLPFSVDTQSINTAQIVNSDKINDHHAVLPTMAVTAAEMGSLPEAQKNILTMICTRLMAAVSNKHIYAETVVTAQCAGEIFTAKGKVIVQNGWKAIEQAYQACIGKTVKDKDKSLPETSEGQEFAANVSIREGFSAPPKRYTEDTLLSAMENAGSEDIPEGAERKGIGTSATRASILEGLVKSGLLERKDKNILPTVKGINLIKVLPDSVKSPMLTAEWESQLKLVERGELSADEFMQSINAYIADVLKTHGTVTEENKALFGQGRQSGEVLGKCPRCGGNITESPKAYSCENTRAKSCEFALFKESKFFEAKKTTLTKEAAKALIANGKVKMTGLFSEKTQKTYSATIVLENSGKGEGYPRFGMEFERKSVKGK